MGVVAPAIGSLVGVVGLVDHADFGVVATLVVVGVAGNRGFRAAPATALLLAGRGLAARRGAGFRRFVGYALNRQHRPVTTTLGPSDRAAAPLPAHENTTGDEIALEPLEDRLVHD